MGHDHEHRLGIEAPHSHLKQGLSAIIFTTIWLLDSLVFSFSTVLNTFVPWLVRLILFIIVIAVAFVFIRSSHDVLFRQPEYKDDLIINGILGHVRNPMYFGVLLIYLACIFLSISLISIAVWIVIIVIYDRLATFEGKQLEELFGQKYLDYKEKVPKWIPR
ncbi:MAG: isoprenylcysteine carboxylmethyltransferase family protein [Candidatus Lokiarchaeota archaeon]|nr:isoprenylcysteine carboxylmethyltransferase family protein [Candidatus Lokiarchaeota archaeon]